MSVLNNQARVAASAIGVVLVRFEEGFYLFKADDGEQLGHPDYMHLPWSAREILDFSAMFQEGLETGDFVI